MSTEMERNGNVLLAAELEEPPVAKSEAEDIYPAYIPSRNSQPITHGHDLPLDIVKDRPLEKLVPTVTMPRKHAALPDTITSV